MTICIVNVKDGYRYGRVESNDGIVTRFVEKDGLHSPASINAGVYFVNAKDLINEAVRIGKDCFSMEKEIFESSKRNISLLAYHCCDSYFIDIGTPDDYNNIKSGFFNKRKKS
jgi:NDP-sugar pyrophosphorylase family protein